MIEKGQRSDPERERGLRSMEHGLRVGLLGFLGLTVCRCACVVDLLRYSE